MATNSLNKMTNKRLTAKRGDNWFNAAERAGTTPQALQAANPGVSRIRAGVSLRIPTTGGRKQRDPTQRLYGMLPNPQDPFRLGPTVAQPSPLVPVVQPQVGPFTGAQVGAGTYNPDPMARFNRMAVNNPYIDPMARFNQLPSTYNINRRGSAPKQMGLIQDQMYVLNDMGQPAPAFGGGYSSGGGYGWGDGGGGGGYTQQPGFSGFRGPAGYNATGSASQRQAFNAGLGLINWRI